MDLVSTFVLIILASGHYHSTCVVATGIEFRSEKTCKQARIVILNNKEFSRIEAFCVKK